MMVLRWSLLSLFAFALGGCSGPTDASNDPNSPVVKSRLDKIEELKSKAAKGGQRPSR